ncbi:MAG: carboxypeptidase-like regulatory domain-containing protein [Bacteroidia bacterium]|nr:carboxypeptidase-like regulatory domain-containing protein [Bacteroidia bacterium]
MVKNIFLICLLLINGSLAALAQKTSVTGYITHEKNPIEYALIALEHTSHSGLSDSTGHFSLIQVPEGNYVLVVKATGFQTFRKTILVQQLPFTIAIELTPLSTHLNEVVVTGTMKEVSRANSPVSIEVISPKLFQKTPTSNIFEGLSMINGIRPQLQCNVCNTGDIHINGMEGPYTMVLIDGMPIVSALSTVYGMMGIPNSIIERIEVQR